MILCTGNKNTELLKIQKITELKISALYKEYSITTNFPANFFNDASFYNSR